jgi:DNA/RNA-binding domain of Phe-tRNA-synthetase-like protein
MFEVTIEKVLKEKCPDLALGVIFCNVTNYTYSKELWLEIEQACEVVKNTYTLETVKTQPQIAATRQAYKNTGKDPNRYRPATDSLYRRIVKGHELYPITVLVDLVNLVALTSGYSIGGFDADKVKGNVSAGIGRKNEKYEGIGRGELNVEGLPILRDKIGGIGTPTSDELRTAISRQTKKFYMNINGYTGKNDLLPVMDYSTELLEKYVSGSDIQTFVIK